MGRDNLRTFLLDLIIMSIWCMKDRLVMHPGYNMRMIIVSVCRCACNQDSWMVLVEFSLLDRDSI